MSDIGHIEAAHQRIKGQIRRTPLLNAPLLDALAGREIWVKAEPLQLTGSFKFRGAYSAISALDAGARQKGVLAYSSGNHAQGVALAARKFGIPAVIVMPKDAPSVKIENTRAYGAEIVLYDRLAGESREAIGGALAKERGLSLIRPFDDAQVIAGQGTVGVELAEQMRDQGLGDAPVLVPCGGGGLTSGVALALAAKGQGAQVHPVEPAGFDDVARSLQSGQREANDQIEGSVCDAILTPSPGELTFPILAKYCAKGLVVHDDEARRAVALAYKYLKLVVEPGGAVALAAAIFAPDLPKHVIVVASGGNIDNMLFAKILSEFDG